MATDHLAVEDSGKPTDTTVVAPRIPLPWAFEWGTKYPRIRGSNESLVCVPPEGFRNERDAVYIVHAANAYPKLVKALRPLAALSQEHQSKLAPRIPIFAINGAEVTKWDVDLARALLAELGESKDNETAK